MDQIIKKRERGQAVIEFLIFFPLMLVLYFILITLGNAINSGINQQKIARGYLYNTIQNDSYGLSNNLLKIFYGDGVTKAGMFAIGWAEYMDGEVPIAPCFKLAPLTTRTENSDETCLTRADAKKTSKYIRLKTAYGICTESYIISNQVGGFWSGAKNVPGNSIPASHYSSCLNPRE